MRRHDDADQDNKVLFVESLGFKACQKGRLQEGSRRRCPKTGCRSSRHVENKHPVPLEHSCRLSGTRQHRPASNGASPPGRMARIRPTRWMPITAQAVTRAWTTSADPPSDANMRRPLRQTAERTLNPARWCPRRKCALTTAI